MLADQAGVGGGTFPRPASPVHVHVLAAQAFIDFLLSESFQADMPLNMFVLPVHNQVALPQPFIDYAVPLLEPAIVPYTDIETNRETWLEAWAKVVLHP